LEPYLILIWVVTEEGEVLLLPAKEKTEKYGPFYQPIEGWQRYHESTLGTISRLIKEALGRKLVDELAIQYYYGQCLPEFLEEKFSFGKRKMATRRHFLWRITDLQLSLIARTDIILVGTEDLARIKKLGDSSNNGDIVLNNADHEVLTKKILNPQRVRPESGEIVSHLFIFENRILYWST